MGHRRWTLQIERWASPGHRLEAARLLKKTNLFPRKRFGGARGSSPAPKISTSLEADSRRSFIPIAGQNRSVPLPFRSVFLLRSDPFFFRRVETLIFQKNAISFNVSSICLSLERHSPCEILHQGILVPIWIL